MMMDGEGECMQMCVCACLIVKCNKNTKIRSNVVGDSFDGRLRSN